jgi:Flp pilus assembly CpaF family ATPase
VTALDDVLASITPDNMDPIVAAIIDRATQVRKTAEADDAALRVVIGQRVANLRTTIDQATAFQKAQSDRAATVTATTPAVNVAYLTLIRDELALIRTDLATVASNQVTALTAIADLATVVSRNL